MRSHFQISRLPKQTYCTLVLILPILFHTECSQGKGNGTINEVLARYDDESPFQERIFYDMSADHEYFGFGQRVITKMY